MKLFFLVATFISVTYGGFYYLLVKQDVHSSINSEEALKLTAQTLDSRPEIAAAFSSEKHAPKKSRANRAPASVESTIVTDEIKPNENFILEKDILSEVQDSNKNALRMEFSKDPAKTIERIQSLVATGNVHESFDQYKNLMEYVVDLTEFSKSTELKNMIFNDLDGQFQGIRGRPESEVAYLFQWKQKIERIEY